MKNARRFFILLTFDIIWSIVDEPEPEPERSIAQHAWSNLPTPEFKEQIYTFTLKNEGDDQLLKIFLRPKCYNKGNCVTRFINAKIYLEEGLYNEIRKKYPKRGLFMFKC